MKYMQTQNCMVTPAVISIIASALNVLLNHVCIQRFGFSGAPIATTITRAVQFVLFVIMAIHMQVGAWMHAMCCLVVASVAYSPI